MLGLRTTQDQGDGRDRWTDVVLIPPNGRVRVAAPLSVSDDAVRLAVIGKLGWIKRQQARFEGQPRESYRETVSGESHYFQGRRYRLKVVEDNGPGQVVVTNNTTLELRICRGTDTAGRQRLLNRWYRQHLRMLIPPLLAIPVCKRSGEVVDVETLPARPALPEKSA